jgi:hypothetical protein
MNYIVLDKILRNLSDNYETFHLRPPVIIKNAGYDMDEKIAHMMCYKMAKDGYLFSPSEGYYQITFDGMLFINEGGYTEKNKKDNLVHEVNQSVKDVNILQKWMLGLTAFFTAATLAVSILDYNKDYVISVPNPKVTLLPLPVTPTQDTQSQNTLQRLPPGRQ